FPRRGAGGCAAPDRRRRRRGPGAGPGAGGGTGPGALTMVAPRSRAARLMRLAAVAARAPFTPNLLPKVWGLYRAGGLRGVVWGLRRQSGEGGSYADWVRRFDTVTDAS